jgi:Rrf2 family protein
MSSANTQFSVAAHLMAALGARDGEGVRSAELAASVNADPSFVRRVLSKLAKAGLVITTRGQHGACSLARAPSRISLLDVYKAVEPPAPCAMHAYPVSEECRVSRNIKRCMDDVLREAQQGFEQGLARQTLADVVDTVNRGR